MRGLHSNTTAILLYNILLTQKADAFPMKEGCIGFFVQYNCHINHFSINKMRASFVVSDK